MEVHRIASKRVGRESDIVDHEIEIAIIGLSQIFDTQFSVFPPDKTVAWGCSERVLLL